MRSQIPGDQSSEDIFNGPMVGSVSDLHSDRRQNDGVNRKKDYVWYHKAEQKGLLEQRVSMITPTKRG